MEKIYAYENSKNKISTSIPSSIATNMLQKKEEKKKDRHWPQVQKILKQQTEAEKPNPLSSQSLQRIFQKWEVKGKGKMRSKWA